MKKSDIDTFKRKNIGKDRHRCWQYIYKMMGSGSIKPDHKNLLNKFGKDKILILILAGVLLMVVTLPTGKTSQSNESATVSRKATV